MAYETAPEDTLLRAKDLKADLVFDDPSSRHLLICQCKHQAPGTPIDESEVNDFFHRHEHFLNRQWVIKHGSADARLALQDYRERLENGYSVTYYFMSTGDASPRVAELAVKYSVEYRRQGVPIDCQLFDFTKLKDYYIRSLSLEESIPDVVEIDLPSDQFFYKENPYPTVVAVVKGNSLRNLSHQFKQALYTWNIRGYLGKRGINQAISDTAQKEPENFFYFNNGVSAICTELIVNGNRIRARKFQIINGAQTVSTLANLEADARLEVLFRLTQTQSVSTEKQFNREIIQYNNSQNAIKLSDFRSNDQIQVWLERAFGELRHHDAVPRLHYLRKRGDPSWRKLLRSDEVICKFWDEYWPKAKAVLVDVFTAAEEEDSTLFAFVRSTERWARMQKRLSRHLAGS